VKANTDLRSRQRRVVIGRIWDLRICIWVRVGILKRALVGIAIGRTRHGAKAGFGGDGDFEMSMQARASNATGVRDRFAG
jgi:hypothetical protein